MYPNFMIEGSSKVEDFFYWIQERHAIWHRRFVQRLPQPWTDDEILREFKFTNVFRELDRGTVLLRDLIKRNEGVLTSSPGLRVFTVFWYRVFCRPEHINDIGVVHHDGLCKKIREKYGRGLRVCPSAYLITGKAGELKHETYLESLSHVWKDRYDLVAFLRECSMLEDLFDYLHKRYYGIGRFLLYEIISDLRWYPHLWKETPRDVLTWANPGPGANRGLLRLGRPKKVRSMIDLYSEARSHLSSAMLQHHVTEVFYHPREHGRWDSFDVKWPFFELREIEHSLCEFDKYERHRLGQGRIKATFSPSISSTSEVRYDPILVEVTNERT